MWECFSASDTRNLFRWWKENYVDVLKINVMLLMDLNINVDGQKPQDRIFWNKIIQKTGGNLVMDYCCLHY